MIKYLNYFEIEEVDILEGGLVLMVPHKSVGFIIQFCTIVFFFFGTPSCFFYK